MAKRLKPGQICTIDKHVYRCKKATTEYICADCREANRGNCVFELNPTFERETIWAPQLKCIGIFGVYNYPVLVK